MIYRKIGMLTILGVMILSVQALGFDCNNPDFGANLNDLNKDGLFVKYMEKGNIHYYNYTGPCKTYSHSHSNPAIAYAFVDNQLYAMIITVSDENTFPPSDEKNEQRLSKKYGSDMKRKQEGNLLIYQFYDKEKKTKYKMKMDAVRYVGKTAWYYEPLREKLKRLDQTADPIDDLE
ncbi:MAG: hypothetical protein AB7S77_13300 [Desulfatirhabdiaceae bacterium]